MAIQTRSSIGAVLAVLLLALPGVAKDAPADASGKQAQKTTNAPRRAKASKPRSGHNKATSRQVSPSECEMMSVMVAVAKARQEMRAVFPAAPDDLSAIGAAMDSDHRLSQKVKQVFGGSELIKSEYSGSQGCVVTVKLPLDRLQGLAQAQ